eukprot:scaffold272920_cov24-Tisochrysis_lutea.AAC.1
MWRCASTQARAPQTPELAAVAVAWRQKLTWLSIRAMFDLIRQPMSVCVCAIVLAGHSMVNVQRGRAAAARHAARTIQPIGIIKAHCGAAVAWPLNRERYQTYRNRADCSAVRLGMPVGTQMSCSEG